MDIGIVLNIIKECISPYILISIIFNVILVNSAVILIKELEDYLEEMNNRQFKIFDHKKIWLNVIFSLLVTIGLFLSKSIEAEDFLMTILQIIGGTTLIYEAVLKKLGVKNEDQRDNS